MRQESRKPYRDSKKPTQDYTRKLCELTGPLKGFRVVNRGPRWTDLLNERGEMLQLSFDGTVKTIPRR